MSASFPLGVPSPPIAMFFTRPGGGLFGVRSNEHFSPLPYVIAPRPGADGKRDVAWLGFPVSSYLVNAGFNSAIWNG